MGVKKYFGDKPQKEPRPFTAQFGVDDGLDVDLIEDTKPSYFPSPEKLAEYEELQEGAADRVLSLVEAEQKHRHLWETRALNKHYFAVKLGQVLFFLLATLVVVASVGLAVNGYTTASVAIAIIGLLAVIRNAKFNLPKQQKFAHRPKKKFHNNKRYRRK